MKQVEIDPAIRADQFLLDAVQKATRLLEDEVGRSSPLVSASWSLLHDDRGRPLVRLALSDWTGSVEAIIASDELNDEWQVQGRMIRIWGDLLQIRSHRLIEELRAAPISSEGA